MARRHFTLTLTITLDEDICRDNEDAVTDDLDYLRTTASHEAGRILHKYDPHLDNPTITYTGITYGTLTADPDLDNAL